jgi:ribosomal protein S12 methylthiotransferase
VLDLPLPASASAQNSAPAEPQGRPRIGFVSLGCPKNLVDSEVMMGLLDRAGGELTAHAEDADIIVVNTCSFIDSAKQESVNTILEMVEHKREKGGKATRLIVAGCLVERYRDEIRKNIPEVDAVVGTGELEAILEAAGLSTPTLAANSNSPFTILPGGAPATNAAIDRHHSAVHQHSLPNGSAEHAPQLASRPEGDLREQQGRFSRAAWDGATAALPQYLYTDTTPRILATPRASAYIKIAEGCDHPCGFCIIPQLRGKFRSRRLESIVAEAESLIARGVREITLIGQDTTCYGEDLGLRGANGEPVGRDHRPPRQHRKIPRRPAAARLPLRAQAHEARRHTRGLPPPHRKSPLHRPGPRPPHQLHRRLPRRDRR